MEILKPAYSRIKTKFKSAIPTLRTGNFLGINEYNELGQLVKKKLNKNADGSFLQEVDYEYNIRGWATKINDPDNLEIAGQPKDLFAMELLYNTTLPTVNNTGDEQFNGNIAAVKWNTPEFGIKAYGYGYDNTNRLERARFAAGSALNVDVDKYTVENITYDANGNIKTLGRHNTATSYIDNLTMDYTGNQLKKTYDSGDLVEGFVDMVDYETEYHYDANGNMDIDDNKGFVFNYNYLNLPEEIIGGNDTVRYIYDATGVKLSKELSQGGIISYTDYIGGLVYKDGELDYILMDEGRITQPTAGVFQYEYFLTDYLGNTRIVFADGNGDGILADTEVLQENHYYPFGMQIGGLAVDRGADNKIKYYGKELQDDDLNGVSLLLYNYNTRYYMPDVPVFTTNDLLAETYSFQSTYAFAINNPVRYTDFLGLGPEDEVKKGEVKVTAETHTVQKGDTYWDLAQNSDGAYTAEDLKTWNPGVDPTKLQVGQAINVSEPRVTYSDGPTAQPSNATVSAKKDNTFEKISSAVDKIPDPGTRLGANIVLNVINDVYGMATGLINGPEQAYKADGAMLSRSEYTDAGMNTIINFAPVPASKVANVKLSASQFSTLHKGAQVLSQSKNAVGTIIRQGNIATSAASSAVSVGKAAVDITSAVGNVKQELEK